MRTAAALLLAALAGVARPAGAGVRIADDYARALAEARARQVPLFIDAWAPW